MTKVLAGVAVAAIALTMSPAGAQTAPPTPPGVAQGTTPMPAPHTPPVVSSPVRVRTVMMKRDMTRDEMVQHIRTMFTHLDANHDGFITKDELEAMHVRMMAMHDASANGVAGPLAMDHQPMRMDPGAMFDRMDTNRDGSISRQEFNAAHAQMQERHVMIMKDGAGRHGGGRMAEHLFGMADANHDGRVSLQEAETAALAHFDRIDANHDGKITPEERMQAHGKMRPHQPG
jgi:Ca2+-binding EF-hand superfamily protein